MAKPAEIPGAGYDLPPAVEGDESHEEEEPGSEVGPKRPRAKGGGRGRGRTVRRRPAGRAAAAVPAAAAAAAVPPGGVLKEEEEEKKEDVKAEEEKGESVDSPMLEDQDRDQEREVASGSVGPPVIITPRSGHGTEWTLVCRTTASDRSQVLCVSQKQLDDHACTLSPLKMCEAIAAVVSPTLEQAVGPVSGAKWVKDVRELCCASRDRMLAEALSSKPA